MEFTAPLASFIKPLQNICSIAGTAASNEDISQNVMLSVKDGTLTIRGTDYRVELSYTVPVSSVADGEILVAASKLRETLSKLPTASLVSFVRQDPDGDDIEPDLIVTTGQTKFQIRTRSADNFPDFDPSREEVEQTITIQQGRLKRIIESSIFCISMEDFREYLRGMRLEIEGSNLTVFTSDGHRMAMLETTVERPLSDPFGVTLIRPCAAELYKILENSEESIDLSFTKSTVVTELNGYKLASKLLLCAFPNVRGVIPREIVTSIPVKRADLKSEIAKVAVLSSKRVNGVNLIFADGFLSLRSENSEHEVATSQMPINYQGIQIDVTLNASYVSEVLGAIQSEEVTFNFAKPLVNALICPADDGTDSAIRTRYIISRVVV